jgi:3-oxoacyl-[acyl-carrier protein] reductase
MGMLSSKVAIVTGGARGIGASIAKRLSEEGAAVAITYSKSKQSALALVEAIEAADGKAIALAANSADVNEVRAAVAQTAKVFGRLDILVNNAGISHGGTVADYSLDDLNEMIAVNIRGAFIAIQEALRYMQEGSRIINIGSVGSDYMPFAGHAVYAMTKGAIASLTRGLARELGPRGITVNNIQPGRIDTNMIHSVFGAKVDEVRQTIALQRFGKPEEVASFVAYLASPDAAFVTGANLKIDGGASL